jgi:hypothetical protein
MSDPVENQLITCPHCGEQIEIVVDRSVPEQQYIEDCSVCCRPILLSVVVPDEESGAEIAVEATE